MTDIIFIKREGSMVLYQEATHKPVEVDFKTFLTACIGSRLKQEGITYDWGGVKDTNVSLVPVDGGRYTKKLLTDFFDSTLTEIKMTKDGFQELFAN